MSEVSNPFVQPLESRTLLSVSAHSGHHGAHHGNSAIVASGHKKAVSKAAATPAPDPEVDDSSEPAGGPDLDNIQDGPGNVDTGPDTGGADGETNDDATGIPGTVAATRNGKAVFSTKRIGAKSKKTSKSVATKSALKQHKNKSAAKAATTTADPDGPGGPNGGPDGVDAEGGPGVDDGTPDGPEAPETGTDTPAAKAKR